MRPLHTLAVIKQYTFDVGFYLEQNGYFGSSAHNGTLVVQDRCEILLTRDWSRIDIDQLIICQWASYAHKNLEHNDIALIDNKLLKILLQIIAVLSSEV